MKTILNLLFSVTITLLISTSVAAANELTSDEITRLFTNKTVSAYSEIAQAPVNLYYDANGEVRGKFSSGKIGKTRWWVNNNQICLKGKKGDSCFVVTKSNGSYQKYALADSGEKKLAFSMETFTAGNINNY